MVFKNFDEIVVAVQKTSQKKKVVVVAAHEKHTLEAVLQAKKDNIVDPILVGHKDKIIEILSELQGEVEEASIFDAQEDAEAASIAVELINKDQADFLMKGKIQTADLLRAVVDKEKGLRTGKVMSHMAIHEVPSYHKLLAVTDGGMVTYPDLDTKKQIIENAVDTFSKMGYENPKVAVLTAVETENPKMPETVDASSLKKMNLAGELANCTVEGPISYDLAMCKESAEVKGFNSTVTGDVDIMVVPNITTGNILGKALIYSAGAKMAGFIVGAKVPIVLTSRGASTQEKYLSIVLAASLNK